ncbi:MAG: hypothetical protein KAT28_04260 [Candidatus Aenigmarchaeota archaeon]|nr:hypothetical protein [Candidatus Aenigmarchaeota archaeon]
MGIPIGLSQQEENYLNGYVGSISKEYFGASYNPKIKPKLGKLPEGVGGVTQTSCTPYKCKPESIVLNETEQAFHKYMGLIAPFHEKTHEAHMKALPYLPMAVGEDFIEGLTVYTNIEGLLKKGETMFAKVYFNSLSPAYKQYYNQMKEVEQKGVSIKDLAKRANQKGMEKVLGKKYSLSGSAGKYN